MVDRFDAYALDVALNGPTDRNRQMFEETFKRERLGTWPTVMPEGYGLEMQRGYEVTGDSLAIVSGGLDSTTLVYDMISKGLRPHCLSFDYGQRHRKELLFAAHTAGKLGLRHDIVDLSGITHLISNSALTSDKTEVTKFGDPENSHKHHIEVPEGHYAEETMKATVVPNRNMIMLSIAAGVAVNNNYKKIGMGIHAGDHFVYPDCRPRFALIMNAAIAVANNGFGPFVGFADGEIVNDYLYTPYIHKSKADIAYRALELKVPLHLTWSCYKGGENHCGRCGTCVERLEAIDEAFQRMYGRDQDHGLYDTASDIDQTMYEDDEFWKTATK